MATAMFSSLRIACDRAYAAGAKPPPTEPRGEIATQQQQQQKPSVPHGVSLIPQAQACAIHDKARPWPQWEEFALLKSTVDGLQDKMIRHLDEGMSFYAGMIYEEHTHFLERLVEEKIEKLMPGPLTPQNSNVASDGSQSTVIGSDSGGSHAAAQTCEHIGIPKQSKPLVSAVMRDSTAGVNSLSDRLSLDDCKAAHPNGCRECRASTATTLELEASIASFSDIANAAADDRVRHLEDIVGVMLSAWSEWLDVDEARVKLQALNPIDVPASGWDYRVLKSKLKQATECSVGRDQRYSDKRRLPKDTTQRQQSAAPCVHGRKAGTSDPLGPVSPRPQRDESQLLGSAGQSPMDSQRPAPQERATSKSSFKLERVPTQSPPPSERVQCQSPLQPERVPSVVHAKVWPSLASGSWPIPSDGGSLSLAPMPRSARGPCAVHVPSSSRHTLVAAFPDGSLSAAPLTNTLKTQTLGSAAPGLGVIPATAVTANAPSLAAYARGAARDAGQQGGLKPSASESVLCARWPERSENVGKAYSRTILATG